MKTILLDGHIYRGKLGGGIERYFTELARWFRENSVDEELLAVVPAQTTPEVLRTIPMRTAPRWMYAHPQLWSLLQPKLFHSTYYTRPDVNCPQVVTVYDFIDARLPGFCPNGPQFVKRQLDAIRKADGVVAISESTKTEIVHWTGIPEARIDVASPGIPPVFTQEPPPADAVKDFRQTTTGGAPYFLHVGYRGCYKNFTLLLEAFCNAAVGSDSHLVLSGGEKSLSPVEHSLLVRHRMADRIHFLGRLDDATLRLAYAGAEAMVHASLMEGFGIPVVEALACGGRLLISDIPVYREVAGDIARYVDPYSLEAWIEALRAVMGSPLEVSEAARLGAIEKYRTDKQGQVYRDLYRRLMAR